MKHILAVDIGTTSAKAIVVNESGDVVAGDQDFYSSRQTNFDQAEQDPDAIFNSVKKIIRNASEKIKGRVEGVCFSSAMHSLVLVDEQGNALTPMTTWADLRSKKEARELKSVKEGNIIYRETGTAIHPMSVLCKIIWYRNNEPELFKRTSRFVGIREYVGYKFFNEFDIDLSIASSTGLLNTAEKTWSAIALNYCGISASRLSTLRSVYHQSKLASKDMADELGLPTNIPWILGGSDGCLAQLGSDAMDPAIMTLTIGTSGAVRKVVTDLNPDHQGRTFHYRVDERTIITGGATNNGAVLVQWFCEKFLNEKVDIQSFGERASTVQAGAENLIFLPFVLGERAPVYDPDATGVFFGIRPHHGKEHFMRAILEGTGYALYSIGEIVEANSGPCNKVIASGGFIKSPHWVQMIADIFNKEVHIRGTADASALGAALLGFKALGVAAKFHFPSEKIFYPDAAKHRTYMKNFSVYKNLYPHLSGDFAAMAELSKP